MSVGSINSRSGGGTGAAALRRSVVAALDVGTSKICCLIAEVLPQRGADGTGEPSKLHVIGAGHHAARGLRAGAVTDMREAELTIRAAVDQAERMAGVTLERVFVNVSGGSPRNQRHNAVIDIGGRPIEPRDADQVFHLARARAASGDRTVVHAAPVEYEIDGHRGIANPNGMFGNRFAAAVNVVSVAPGPMRNLALCVERCHLEISGLVMSPFASGVAALVDDERELGATCIDMGAGTTSLAMFHEGRLLHGEVIPLGGQHITNDIARGLSTYIAHAERMKTLFGGALACISDDRELVSVPLIGEKGSDKINRIPKSMLIGIIQPRLEEILEIVRDRIERSGLGAVAGRRLVLTGGASQLTGTRELAVRLLDRQVRIGTPLGVEALPDSCQPPGLATAAGLLKYALLPEASAVFRPGPMQVHHGDAGYLSRVGNWIRQSF